MHDMFNRDNGYSSFSRGQRSLGPVRLSGAHLRGSIYIYTYTATASTCNSPLLLSYLTVIIDAAQSQLTLFLLRRETSTKLSYLNSVIVARAAALSAHREQPEAATPRRVVRSIHPPTTSNTSEPQSCRATLSNNETIHSFPLE